jgi:hypothetical protein
VSDLVHMNSDIEASRLLNKEFQLTNTSASGMYTRGLVRVVCMVEAAVIESLH